MTGILAAHWPLGDAMVVCALSAYAVAFAMALILPEAAGNGEAFNRHVEGLGGTLYTEHLVTVELAGALLFVALIGAAAIATPRAPIRPATSDAAPKA